MSSAIDFTKFYNIIDGKQRGASEVHQGLSPTTGEKLWDVPVGTEQDLNDAIAVAKKAQVSWAQTSEEERFAKTQEFLKLWKEHEKDFVDLLCKETGKPRVLGQQEVEYTNMWFSFAIQDKLPIEIDEDDAKVVKTTYKPLGVVGVITPWNFPLLLSAGKISPALATGNTVVMKPSPYTPYSSLKMVELMNKVFPPGVVNIINGNDKTGPQMTQHPDIAKISFTGSTAAGKKIMAACASTLKRVTLELGGNDVAIVMPDVDVDVIAPELVMAAFQTSGQVCVATKRIYVHDSIYEPFLAKMKETAGKMKVGLSDEEGVLMGPVQNKMQFDRVKEFFAHAKDNNLTFASGGPTSYEQNGKGYFIQPTIIANPPDTSMVVTEEAFGPIVPVMKYSSDDEVIARANNSPNGLGGSVWANDVKKAEALADRIETGTVWINSMAMPNPYHFFPTFKESGIGGEWGKAGKLTYCNAQVKQIWKQPQLVAKMMGIA